MRKNCWQIKKCGRQPGGENINEMGICPAATEQNVDGINGGTNGGRSCWAIQKTICHNQIQGAFKDKFVTCLSCDFYAKVREEEGINFTLTEEIIQRLEQANLSLPGRP